MSESNRKIFGCENIENMNYLCIFLIKLFRFILEILEVNEIDGKNII